MASKESTPADLQTLQLGWGSVIQDLNCYEAIRESYSATLENKSFVAHGKYHPALDTLAPRLQKA